MIEIYYFIKNKEGKWVEAHNVFYDVRKASDFIFMMKSKGACYFAWSCYDPEDNEYLQRMHPRG